MNTSHSQAMATSEPGPSQMNLSPDRPDLGILCAKVVSRLTEDNKSHWQVKSECTSYEDSFHYLFNCPQKFKACSYKN